MDQVPRAQQLTRKAFDSAYDEFVLPGGFNEVDTYYEISRERYWQTLRYYAGIDLPRPAKLLEVGGGQIAILAAKLFGDTTTIGDIGDTFRAPADKAGVQWVKCNLMEDDPAEFKAAFDIVVLAEVIEHLPIPPYVILSKIRSWLHPNGVVLMTTPNLFRLRNVIRMLRGRDPFDRFTLPHPNRGLGHQTEYSGDHLAWQMREAGFRVEGMHHDQLGNIGFSFGARLARRLLSPLQLRQKWREELVAIGRNPA
jgi:hypothetical protein